MKNIIIVTDGDRTALKAVEAAAANIGGHCISLSSGNPTVLSGLSLEKLVNCADGDPVVVMVDDRGEIGTGRGELALAYLAESKDINMLGIVAVASNSSKARGIKPDCCITCEGTVITGVVDKDGCEKDGSEQFLTGDTVEILNYIDVPVIVGTGDIGKMEGQDDCRKKAPITTMALKEILRRNGAMNYS